MFEPEGQETYTVYILMLNFRHNWGYLFVWLEMVGGESEYYEDVEQLLFLFPSGSFSYRQLFVQLITYCRAFLANGSFCGARPTRRVPALQLVC